MLTLWRVDLCAVSILIICLSHEIPLTNGGGYCGCRISLEKLKFEKKKDRYRREVESSMRCEVLLARLAYASVRR